MRVFVLGLFLFLSFQGQAVEVVGTDVSDSYFRSRARSHASSANLAHFIGIHFGTFIKDEALDWSETREKNRGKSLFGTTYRLGELGRLVDMSLRFNYTNYNLTKKSPRQFSLSPLFLIPSTRSQFPLYLGAGLGLGAIFSQVDSKSFLALNYHLLTGLRFFNVFGSVGTFLEAGYTGHVHLISNGEFHGFYILVGLLFTF